MSSNGNNESGVRRLGVNVSVQLIIELASREL